MDAGGEVDMVASKGQCRWLVAAGWACCAVLPASAHATSRFIAGGSEPVTARTALDFTIRVPPLLVLRARPLGPGSPAEPSVSWTPVQPSAAVRYIHWGAIEVIGNAGTLSVLTEPWAATSTGGPDGMSAILSAAMP